MRHKVLGAIREHTAGSQFGLTGRQYFENHSKADLLDRVLDEELPRYAEALERLGQ
jgi:hypothetical protein